MIYSKLFQLGREQRGQRSGREREAEPNRGGGAETDGRRKNRKRGGDEGAEEGTRGEGDARRAHKKKGKKGGKSRARKKGLNIF